MVTTNKQMKHCVAFYNFELFLKVSADMNVTTWSYSECSVSQLCFYVSSLLKALRPDFGVRMQST